MDDQLSDLDAALIVIGVVGFFAAWAFWQFPRGPGTLVDGQVTEISVHTNRTAMPTEIVAKVRLADGREVFVVLDSRRECRPLDYIQILEFDYSALAISGSCRPTVKPSQQK